MGELVCNLLKENKITLFVNDPTNIDKIIKSFSKSSWKPRLESYIRLYYMIINFYCLLILKIYYQLNIFISILNLLFYFVKKNIIKYN